MRSRDTKILQQEAYDYIKRLILDNSIEYNRIYSESKLALEIGVSRTPVRDAINRLYQEGYIDIIPNKGFSLHKMTEQDVLETYEIRSAIEGYCAMKAAEDNQTSSVRKLIASLDNSLKKQKRIFETSGDIELFATEEQHFHYFLVSSRNNEAFNNIVNKYMYKTKKLACYSLENDNRMEKTLGEHYQIYEAIRDGDALKAYNATLYHMQAPLDLNLKSVYK